MLFYIVYGLQLANGFEGYWPSILYYTTYMTGVFIWIPIVSKIGIQRSLYWSVFITIVSIISVAFGGGYSSWLAGSALVSGFSISAIPSMTTTLLFRFSERSGKGSNKNPQAIIIFIVFILLIATLLAIRFVNLPLLTFIYGVCLICILFTLKKMPAIEKVKEMSFIPIMWAVGRFLLFSLFVILLRTSRDINNEQIIFFIFLIVIALICFMLLSLLRGNFFHKLSSSLPIKLKALSFLLGLGNGYLFLIGIFYSFTFYNILTVIFILVGPYLLGILMSPLLNNNKITKKLNPVYIFILSTFLMLFGFYSPIFIILSVTIGSATINLLSSQSNLKAYTLSPSHRELSLLFYTTWKNIGNICMQFFVLVVIVMVGIYYNVEWSQLFQTIVGKHKLQIPELSVPSLMFILAFSCWLGMVSLAVWVSKGTKPKYD
ncbi:hypothetical protein JDS99_22910 [Bacillus cereus group sp. N6]|uniref:hypothetical protein n=1 Tax=Bacillus cereus group sp. N6 TaxID=2794583 RepID=UPI0018F3BF7B|nr:hypothetical protein [Bacillus cereus group sp. N6]MBJ8112438.1 hypothetical protein [Bacillus cereus group sp. N6]